MNHIKPLIPYLTALILISGSCGLVYAAVQQDLRQTANDPQIQMAEDGARALVAGKKPGFQAKFDIGQSLSPFMVVLNKDGSVESNGQLDGKDLKIPQGVLDVAKQKGETRVTWQPKAGVREALVIVPVETGGFIAVGRSLREVEKREDKTLQIAAAAWVIMLAVTFGGIFAYTEKS